MCEAPRPHLEASERSYLRLPPLSDSAQRSWDSPEILERRRALGRRLLQTVTQEIAAGRMYAEALQRFELPPMAGEALFGLVQSLELAQGEVRVIAALLRGASAQRRS